MSDDSFPPYDPQQQPVQRARRRRARRNFFPADAEGQDAMLAELSRRAYPSYELYVFSFLCAVILAAGFAFDSQALLIFGALTAPTLTAWVGLSLATLTGPIRFFGQTFTAILVSVLIVLIIGFLAGFASLPFQPITLNEVYHHSRLWWPDLLVLAIGAVLTTVTFVRTESRPALQSALLAYEFYLPISAAGFGLGAGLIGVWPEAVLVFLVYFAWATFFGLVTLLLLRFRPLAIGNFFFSASIFVLILILLANFLGLTDLVKGIVFGPPPAAAALSTSTPPQSALATGTPTPSLTPSPSRTASATPSIDSVPPTLLGGDVTFPATETPVPSATFEPTPVYAKIASISGGGAFMRKTPGGEFLTTLENGVLVEVLGETAEANGVTWIKIAAIKNGLRMEGWIIQSALIFATPVVNWQPSSTPAFTPTQ